MIKKLLRFVSSIKGKIYRITGHTHYFETKYGIKAYNKPPFVLSGSIDSEIVDDVPSRSASFVTAERYEITTNLPRDNRPDPNVTNVTLGWFLLLRRRLPQLRFLQRRLLGRHSDRQRRWCLYHHRSGQHRR